MAQFVIKTMLLFCLYAMQLQMLSKAAEINPTNGSLINATKLIVEAKDPLESVQVPKFRPKDCSELKLYGDKKSGIRIIYSSKNYPLKVECDQETDGGGWTIIQARRHPVIKSFDLNYQAYALGFVIPGEEYWLGLDNIAYLTNFFGNEVRFDIENFEGEKRYAKYSFYTVTKTLFDIDNHFHWTIQGYSGDAGDPFSNKSIYSYTNILSLKCAMVGSYWEDKKCNSEISDGASYKRDKEQRDEIKWITWNRVNLKYFEMKIRPSFMG